MKRKSQILTKDNIKKLFFVLGFTLISYSVVHAQNAAIIDLDSSYQIIRGFGASNIMPWRPDMTTDEIETAFGTEDGQIGFSILRLRVPTQENEFRLNVPTARAAHSLGVTIIAAPWSPPASMKTNNNTVGGELDESHYADFADHLNSFIDYMADNDAPIYGISVQNEPDVSVTYESCDWNASQMIQFLKENAPSVKTKIMAPESFQFRRELSDPILNDPDATANLDILAGHIYGGGLAPYPLAESKGKEIWMTEHLILQTDWPAALSTANDINACLRAGMSAYIWWYIVRFYGPIYDDGTHPDTPPGAVKGEVSKRGFAMSQFARFIRPGYVRVECPGVPQRNITASAYKDSTGSKVVIVAINNSSQAIEQTFTLQNGNVEMFTPYVTSATKDCSRESDVSVSNGSFSFSLEGSSVTTFVSSGNPVSVEDSPSIVESYQLHQNYPNPFNPSTRINFQIPEKSFVSLEVYNLRGEDIVELAGKEFTVGEHSVVFDASGLPNGIYFYTLKAGAFEQTRKMFFIK